MTSLTTPVAKIKPSATLAINEGVKARWARGETVFHLGFGESRFPVHPILTKALAAAAGEKSYLPGQGLPALRDAVAAYYSDHLALDVSPEQVLIGPGSKLLLYALQMTLGAPLYLPAPSWVSYAPQAELLGLPIRHIPGRVEDDYALDFAALDDALARDPAPAKLLIVNTPGNPTGRMLPQVAVEQLAALARRHQLTVASDEIYFRLAGAQHAHQSPATAYPEGTFVFGGLSKHLSLGGWRLGVMIAPKTTFGAECLNAMNVIASETWSCVSAPVQHAAVAAYQNSPELESHINDCAKIHEWRTTWLYEQLCELGIRSTQPMGAFYLTVNFDSFREGLRSREVLTSTDLANHLLAEHHIATLPCADFGLPPETLSLRLASSYLDMEDDEAAGRLLALFESGCDREEFLSPEHHPQMHACRAAFGHFVDSLA
ncbi:MAG: aminotransferase class I/II-fold pyridoxal phosphate-dependent enzyme [Pseudomonadota bacterium]